MPNRLFPIDDASGEIGYSVLAATNPAGPYEVATLTQANGTGGFIVGLQPATTYFMPTAPLAPGLTCLLPLGIVGVVFGGAAFTFW